MTTQNRTKKTRLLNSISTPAVPSDNVIDQIVYIKRWIHFYNLRINFDPSFPTNGNEKRIVRLFRRIIEITSESSLPRFQVLGDKFITLRNVGIDESRKCIFGQVLSSRDGNFPEIMDRETGKIRPVEAGDTEDIVETTHFMVDYSKQSPRLIIEFNQTGARVNDLVSYIQAVGVEEQILISATFGPITKNILSRLKNKMGLVSEFIVQIDRENLSRTQELDNGLITGLAEAGERFLVDYIQIKLKFEYKKVSNEPIQSNIMTLVDNLLRRPDKTELFNTLKVKAQDVDNNYKLEAFDLLIDKVKTEVNVQKKKKHRTIISNHMFELIYEASVKN